MEINHPVTTDLRQAKPPLKLHLLTTWPDSSEFPWHRKPYASLRKSLAAGAAASVIFAPSPEEAEVILFADPGPALFQKSLRAHPVFKRFREKCFVLDSSDQPFPWVPGLYASLEKAMLVNGRTRGGLFFHYTDDIFAGEPWNDPPLLCSFAGSIGHHPIRQAMQNQLAAHGTMIDTSGQVGPAFTTGDRRAISGLRNQMIRLSQQSRFILCPRGMGAGSIRLFEVMQMARCPVIISDDWVPPQGPDWTSCSVRIREDRMAELPALLRQLSPQAQAMGLKAREAYDAFFAPDTRLRWIASELADLQRPSRTARLRHSLMLLRLLTRPYFVRMRLRSFRHA